MSAFQELILSAIRPLIKKRVNETIERELTRRIPKIVDEVMREKFKRDPNRALSHVGFLWALIVAFEEAWPDMDRNSAVACAYDCLEVPHGTPGYDWDAAAASELVREYVSEHSEGAS